MKEDMRGLFFIVKGQYRKGVEPTFTNRVTGDTQYLGGYDPENENTKEWYMCLDKEYFHCVACGSDLKKVLHSVFAQITRYKNRHRYLLRVEKGVSAKTSPTMTDLYRHLYNTFGDYYEDLVEEQEDLAYQFMKDNTPVKVNGKRFSKLKMTNKMKKVTEEEKTPPKKMGKLKLHTKSLKTKLG